MKNLDEIKLFKKGQSDYTFEDLVKEIYNDTIKKRATIQESILALTSQLGNDKINPRILSSIAQLLPQYFEKDIKNSQQLVNLATVIQRMNQRVATSDGSELGLTEEEKEELIQMHKNSAASDSPGESSK